MPHKPNKGWGALFSVPQEEGKQNQPAYEGHITCPVCNGWIKLIGWVKEAKETGRRYLNMKAVPHAQSKPVDARQTDLPTT